MNRHWRWLVAGLLGAAAAGQITAAPANEPAANSTSPARTFWLENLDLAKMTQRRGTPRAGRSIRDLPIVLGGKIYAHGIGTRSISEFVIDVAAQATHFESMVGIDDVVKNGVGTVTFEVWTDDTLAADSGLMRAGDPPKLLTADLTGVHVLTLLLDDGGDTSNDDEAAWGDARIRLPVDATDPKPFIAPLEAAPSLAPVRVDAISAIHGPRVTGGTPGRPFLFRIPATGKEPLMFRARGLPQGLHLDAHTGIISGSIKSAGSTRVQLVVKGRAGTATRALTIVGGDDALARTPPMGWNSWNVWGPAVDAHKVLAAAAALERSGLAAHGYQYIVIDDTWEGTRDASGHIQPNEKFPDLRALAAAIHARGLKLGIYSSPGTKTCENFEGSYQHEELDAETYASWGVDFLKHDWCSYEDIAPDHSRAALQQPYLVMRDALRKTDRDIVYSLCQYGFGEVWQWGADVGGNLWRSSGDLLDFWSNLQSVGFRQAGREAWTRPGHWNDTDMLVVGSVGWGPNLHATRLTPNEQLLHLSLWALQAAPLFIGADLSQLDPFTLALLTNDEVLDVDQDPLGKAASRLWQRGRLEVWARPLVDGTAAVGLFNRGLAAADVTVRWADLNISGAQPVRDLWRREQLGMRNDAFTARVPRHGAILVRIGRAATL